MLEALKKTLGIVTQACEATGISRQCHYDWIKSDAAYKKAAEEMEEIGLDFTESRMFKGIKDGDASLIKFHLQTKGRKRGYGVVKELTGPGGEPLHPQQPISAAIIAGDDAIRVYERMLKGE